MESDVTPSNLLGKNVPSKFIGVLFLNQSQCFHYQVGSGPKNL